VFSKEVNTISLTLSSTPETNRRKKLLRAAQKSIMLWDPDGAARKPPREAAEILLSVEELFGLSAAFQSTTEPDFLLMTLGGTSRESIERAYDWLIPVISRLPNTIARLPSSASCFLLLRAYGTDGEERTQLKELSAPLLSHVAGCLKGTFGQSESMKAFDLLLSDVASHKPDRRRCARTVLQASLKATSTDSPKQHWTARMLEVEFAETLAADAIEHLAKAATFERGGVLRTLVVALENHLSFAEFKSIDTTRRFPDLVVELISGRPNVFAEAMDSFAELRSLIIRVVHEEFTRHVEGDADGDEFVPGEAVILKVRRKCGTSTAETKLPMSLLKSTSVILSIWKDEASNSEQPVSGEINELVDALLEKETEEVDDNQEERKVGLADAVMSGSIGTDGTAVSVEVVSRVYCWNYRRLSC
jgi:integrator complex subunit 1